MVLGKLPVLGRPTSLEESRARVYCAYSWCGRGRFGHFFLSSIISPFFLPLKGRGWSGGAMVLGKFPVPGRPTNLDHRRARACCACSG